MKHKGKLSKIVIVILINLLFMLEFQLQAAPWISPNNIWLRANIEYLSDRGIIKTPITTWPIMWSSIRKDFIRALKPENFSKLSLREQDSLLHLKKSFRRVTNEYSSISLKLASDTEVIRGFHDTPREKSVVEFSRAAMGDHWAYQFNVSYDHDPYMAQYPKKDKVNFDGSFVTTVYENFSIAYGYVDKWWGPGWDSSLILSNNARPTPGIMLQRNYSDPLNSEWLSWMGPWTINIFASVLDDERHIMDAKLLGVSVSLKPFNWLEIGLRRTGQWAGEGRPRNISSLINMFLGKDNCDNPNCKTKEPGNQLGAIDFRLRLPTELPISVYFQVMGEDEAGYLPSKKSHQFGFSSSLEIEDVLIKYYIEYSDTTINTGGAYNVVYNHHIYQTGYRYFGRSLASTYDNDSESLVIGSIMPLATDKHLYIQLSDINLNVDNTGKHTINTNNVHVTALSAIYRQKFKYGQLNVFYTQFSDIIDEYLRQENKTRLGVSWKMNFN